MLEESSARHRNNGKLPPAPETSETTATNLVLLSKEELNVKTRKHRGSESGGAWWSCLACAINLTVNHGARQPGDLGGMHESATQSPM